MIRPRAGAFRRRDAAKRREGLLDNLGLKAGALLVALLLWVYLNSEEKSVVEFENVPLRLENVPADLVISAGKIETVQVRLRGSSATLRNLSPVQVDARVSLSELRPGEVVVPLDASVVRHPPFGVEIEWVRPAQLELRVEARARREVTVKPEFREDPPEGYAVLSWASAPETVIVEGAQSHVEEAEVTTDPISLAGRTQSFRERVRVRVRPPQLQVASGRLATIAVRIEPRAGLPAAPASATGAVERGAP